MRDWLEIAVFGAPCASVASVCFSSSPCVILQKSVGVFSDRASVDSDIMCGAAVMIYILAICNNRQLRARSIYSVARRALYIVIMIWDYVLCRIRGVKCRRFLVLKAVIQWSNVIFFTYQTVVIIISTLLMIIYQKCTNTHPYNKASYSMIIDIVIFDCVGHPNVTMGTV